MATSELGIHACMQAGNPCISVINFTNEFAGASLCGGTYSGLFKRIAYSKL